jgi:hypothetical protein
MNDLEKLGKEEGKTMKTYKVVLSVLIAVLLSVPLISTQAEADAVWGYSGSSGNLSASASFTLTGTQLMILLTNTSKSDVITSAQLLAALLFTTGETLTPVSAVLGPGSTCINGTCTNIGGNWQYLASAGISAAGFGVFGPSGNFPNGTPATLDGANYLIYPNNSDYDNDNTGITGNGPDEKNSVLFTFTAPADLSAEDFSDVMFQYGTALTDTHFGTPEPSTLLLLGAGLLGVGFVRRKFKK